MIIEQIAIHDAVDFPLREMFDGEWVYDTVTAKGIVRGHFLHDGFDVIENVANLAFNYDAIPGKELELIHYNYGKNFLGLKMPGSLSHLGWHVDSIDDWREDMDERGFCLVQEVITLSHTSPAVDKRYHYAIYNHEATRYAWKLIERVHSERADEELGRLLRRYK